MQFRKCICTFLILTMLVTSVNAADITAAVAGKSATEAATIKAQMIVNESAVKAISKDYTEPITSGGKSIGEINIKSISYDAKMNAVKVVYTATINGVEKQIVNPVYIRNPPARIVTGTKLIDEKDESAGIEYTTEENPKEALLQTLLNVARNRPDGSATFIPGDPTLVVYANAADAIIQTGTSGQTFTYWRNYASGTVYGATSASINPKIESAFSGSNLWQYISRGFEPFDTSSIGSTSTVTSGTLYLNYMGYYSRAFGNWSEGITPAYPDNPTSLTSTDFSKVSNNRVAADLYVPTIPYYTFYNNVTFPLTNLTFINKVGWTTIAVRTADDIDDYFNGTYVNSGAQSIAYHSADESGTTYDPRMEIIYVENMTPPTAAFSCTPLAGDTPLAVTCTDASTGGGFSSWNWSLGDGSYADTQNVSHTYTGLGVFSVNLTVTNPLGSDFEYKLNYINVTTHPVINITARTHFVFNGTNQSIGVDNWSWKFSEDGNVSTTYGQNIERWLEWGLTHVITLTGVEGVNSTTVYETVNLQGSSSSGGGNSTGGASMAQDDTIAYTVGFLSMIGVCIAIGLALAGKGRNRQRRNER